jgi:capsular polysaccharide biosynthesis protein
MSEQALDLKRSLQIVRRHWLAVSIAAVVGLGGGGAYAALQTPTVSSTAQVRIASSGGSSGNTAANSAATQVVIADSDPVLRRALPHIKPPVSQTKLQKLLDVRSPAPSIISIRAVGRTATEAERTANAVALAYTGYVNSPESLSGSLRAILFQPASTATGRPLAVSIAIFGVIGLLLGAILGAIGALAVSRRDRRLLLRDEIADSLGIPVLASIPVGHPSDAGGWVKLLTEYEPTAVDAWRLRGALHYLGLEDAGSVRVGHGEAVSLAVLSLRSDPGALALGPQLAVFAASLGIRTQLMVGPQQDPNATATLRAACSGMAAVKSRWSRFLQVTVRDEGSTRDLPTAALTVLVAVVDEESPRIVDRMRTHMAVLGVSAGAATAEDLARVAVSAADNGRQIAGILVADPDPADTTTGRAPQSTRTTARRAPTHLTGIPTETRQWMTQTRRSQ